MFWPTPRIRVPSPSPCLPTRKHQLIFWLKDETERVISGFQAPRRRLKGPHRARIHSAVRAVCDGHAGARAAVRQRQDVARQLHRSPTRRRRKPCESLASFTGEGIVSIQARVVRDSRHAAALPRDRRDRARGGLRGESAGPLEPPLLHDRQRRPGRRPGRHADQRRSDAALTNGFVHARTNTGHDARKEPSGSFILSNPQKAIDYAYRAVHVTADTAKKIANEYYAQPITFSYWNSCSNGGRQGLLEAQRYPSDFDGIVAIAPWVDQTGFAVGAIWNQKALTEAPVTPAKMALVAQKVMDKCDAVDGLKDGLIDDPRACRFDAARDVPACSAGVGRRRLPDAGAGRGNQQGLQRAGEQRQAVHRRLHARQRGRDDGAERRDATAGGSAPSCRRSPAPSPRTSTWPKASCAT